jgi:drug/metabolite transporter (DMT)-like permease
MTAAWRRSIRDPARDQQPEWLAILAIVLSSSAGDVLLSRGMKQIGDLGKVRRKHGFNFVMVEVLRNRYFLIGVACMAISFYSLLFGLSWNEVSLIGPAAASLTFVANAFAAKIFLHERVDRRRWAAALFVAAGVVLMAF